MQRADSLAKAQALSTALVAATLPAYFVTHSAWLGMVAEAESEEVMPSALFAGALGGAVVRSEILYTFSGRQPKLAHADEVPEDLLHLKHLGMFNIHHVVSGAVSTCMVHTRAGYYDQDRDSRIPRTGFNFGITEDLLRRKNINTYSTETEIHEARLEAGDRVVFFERTSLTVDGPPNVVHLFYRGTEDRYSETSRYFAKVA